LKGGDVVVQRAMIARRAETGHQLQIVASKAVVVSESHTFDEDSRIRVG
jgi:hypothetical protein